MAYDPLILLSLVNKHSSTVASVVYRKVLQKRKRLRDNAEITCKQALRAGYSEISE